MQCRAFRVSIAAAVWAVAPVALADGPNTPTARFGDVEAPAPTPPRPRTAPSAAPAPASPPSGGATRSAPAAPAGGAARRPAPASSSPAESPAPSDGSAAAPNSSYLYQEVVNPFERDGAARSQPAAASRSTVRRPIPHVDDLLIVNPYSAMLGRTDARKASPRYFSPPKDPSVPGTLEIRAPSGFHGWVYLNGIALPSLPSRSVLLAGEHAVTVVPVDGASFTVWVQVDAGQRRRFRFALGSSQGVARPEQTVSIATPTSAEAP